ncbi:MAG: bifunctional oligoribonuclease/PAP phosphatase NrnA [Chthoniobacterales bacterium]|nr:bifunctional oligoribonuclease/PAP phosphatase NrnA [Chthoniobacterales bacterium]
MSVTNSFSEICKLLPQARRILVVSHARPDGDALGSTLAVALWLKSEGHQVTVWNEDGLPEKFSYLPESSLLSRPPGRLQHFDAVFVLDTANKERLGKTVLASFEAPLWIALDHHVSNDQFGDINFIDATAPATGQILAEGMLQEGIIITPAMATNLYVAISTDTGSFQYSQTSAKTFEIAASLIRAGVNVEAISQAMYASQPWRRFELLRHALTNVQLSPDGRVVSFALSLADALSFGIQPEDTEGIIDVARSVEGVMVAVFFEELPEGKVRLSLRSKTEAFDAALFCSFYGGGGHRMAAGARIASSLEKVEKEVLARIAATLPP